MRGPHGEGEIESSISTLKEGLAVEWASPPETRFSNGVLLMFHSWPTAEISRPQSNFISVPLSGDNQA
jgi:hypothetical protein